MEQHADLEDAIEKLVHSGFKMIAGRDVASYGCPESLLISKEPYQQERGLEQPLDVWVVGPSNRKRLNWHYYSDSPSLTGSVPYKVTGINEIGGHHGVVRVVVKADDRHYLYDIHLKKRTMPRTDYHSFDPGHVGMSAREA